jgi:predicted enzyme related to lactoylglutathione lyase
MFRVSNVSHITYPTTDYDKTLDFLTSALGGYLQQRGSTTYVGFADTLLELSRRETIPADPERPIGYIFGLVVDDLDAAIADLTGKGIEVTRPIWQARTFYGRQAVIRDPGGTQLALREYREPDGPHFTGWQPEED